MLLCFRLGAATPREPHRAEPDLATAVQDKCGDLAQERARQTCPCGCGCVGLYQGCLGAPREREREQGAPASPSSLLLCVLPPSSGPPSGTLVQGGPWPCAWQVAPPPPTCQWALYMDCLSACRRVAPLTAILCPRAPCVCAGHTTRHAWTHMVPPPRRSFTFTRSGTHPSAHALRLHVVHPPTCSLQNARALHRQGFRRGGRGTGVRTSTCSAPGAEPGTGWGVWLCVPGGRGGG